MRKDYFFFSSLTSFVFYSFFSRFFLCFIWSMKFLYTNFFSLLFLIFVELICYFIFLGFVEFQLWCIWISMGLVGWLKLYINTIIVILAMCLCVGFNWLDFLHTWADLKILDLWTAGTVMTSSVHNLSGIFCSWFLIFNVEFLWFSILFYPYC